MIAAGIMMDTWPSEMASVPFTDVMLVLACKTLEAREMARRR